MKFYKIFIRVIIAACLLSSTSYAMYFESEEFGQGIDPNAPALQLYEEGALIMSLEGEPMPKRLLPLLKQLLTNNANNYFSKYPQAPIYYEEIHQKNGITACWVCRR